MSFADLLVWIGLGRLEESAAPEVLELVDASLDGMAEDDPRYHALTDIEDALLDGQVPVALLQRLARDFPLASPEPVDPADRLERDYRARAAAYGEQEWRSLFYSDLERHLDESDDEELLGYAQQLRERITASWQRYSDDFSRLEASSPEIEVGHRFMKEGYERWMQALDMVEADADADDILAVAEEAVRLLAAVAQLDRDVKMQASTLDSTFRPGR